MKRLTLIGMAMILFLASFSWAGENKLQIKGSWETAVSSQYLAFPGMVVHDEPIWENQLALKFGDSGWHAGIWSAMPLSKKTSSSSSSSTPQSLTLTNSQTDIEGNQTTNTLEINWAEQLAEEEGNGFEGEIDFWVGYDRLCLNDRLKLGFQFNYFAICDLGDFEDDQLAFDLKASLPKFPVIQPYVLTRIYGEISDTSPEKGVFCFAGFTRSQPLGFQLPASDKEQVLDLDVKFAWSDGAMDGKPGFVYSRIIASTDFQLGKNWFLTASLAYQMAADNQNGESWDYVDGDQWVTRLACRLEF